MFPDVTLRSTRRPELLCFVRVPHVSSCYLMLPYAAPVARNTVFYKVILIMFPHVSQETMNFHCFCEDFNKPRIDWLRIAFTA